MQFFGVETRDEIPENQSPGMAPDARKERRVDGKAYRRCVLAPGPVNGFESVLKVHFEALVQPVKKA